MTLDALTIEAGLQERFELQGHTITYGAMSRNGSTLVCVDCRVEVELCVNDLGGWWTSSRDLDKPCRGVE